LSLIFLPNSPNTICSTIFTNICAWSYKYQTISIAGTKLSTVYILFVGIQVEECKLHYYENKKTLI